MINRKPRIQGKIANLPAKEREQVHEWLRQNLTYKQIAEKIQKGFGVKISTGALCSYYECHSQEIFATFVNDGKSDPTPILQIEIGSQIETGAVLLKMQGRQIIQIFGREKPAESLNAAKEDEK